MSILNKNVSYFPGITATNNGVTIKLLELLKGDKHKKLITQIRQSERHDQKQLKQKLPCYTVSGVFSRRCDNGLVLPSGLAAVDFDSAENYDTIPLLKELRKIDSIAYAGLSCRGERLFCVVPFANPNKYQKHYERLMKSFEDIGLSPGDDCHKRISQPRFVSWNDESTQFFNHQATPYSLLAPEKTYHHISPPAKLIGPTSEGSFKWCEIQINKSFAFIIGQRHSYIIKLARYCNIKGLSESDTLDGCLAFSQEDFSKLEIEGIVKAIYKKHKGSHGKLPFKKR
jgi:hypothetical protein